MYTYHAAIKEKTSSCKKFCTGLERGSMIIFLISRHIAFKQSKRIKEMKSMKTMPNPV